MHAKNLLMNMHLELTLEKQLLIMAIAFSVTISLLKSRFGLNGWHLVNYYTILLSRETETLPPSSMRIRLMERKKFQ